MNIFLRFLSCSCTLSYLLFHFLVSFHSSIHRFSTIKKVFLFKKKFQTCSSIFLRKSPLNQLCFNLTRIKTKRSSLFLFLKYWSKVVGSEECFEIVPVNLFQSKCCYSLSTFHSYTTVLSIQVSVCEIFMILEYFSNINSGFFFWLVILLFSLYLYHCYSSNFWNICNTHYALKNVLLFCAHHLFEIKCPFIWRYI